MDQKYFKKNLLLTIVFRLAAIEILPLLKKLNFFKIIVFPFKTF